MIIYLNTIYKSKLIFKKNIFFVSLEKMEKFQIIRKEKEINVHPQVNLSLNQFFSEEIKN